MHSQQSIVIPYGKEEEEEEEKKEEEKEEEEEEEEENRFLKVLFLFLFGSSVTLSDHFPITFVTYWHAIFLTLLQNWQRTMRAKQT